MIAHHPTTELLLDYAAGALPEPIALAVATHVALCGACRAGSDDLDAVGGALLDGLDPAALADDALAAVMLRLGEPGDETAPVAAPPALDARTRAIIPAPLRAYLAGNLDDQRWRWKGPSMRELRIDLRDGHFRASLFRLRPGGSAPAHTHHGNEYTVLLDGSFSEDGVRFAPGDFLHADASRRHVQIADPAMGCICLAVHDAPVRLTGLLGVLVNPFLRF